VASPSPPTAQDVPPRPFAARVADWLVSRRVLLFLVGLILAAAAVERSRTLAFSRSIDAMFDRTDPDLRPYHRLVRTFGSSEVVLAVYDDPALFTREGVDRLRGLTQRLAAVPGVAATTSLATTPLGDAIIDVDTNVAARRLVSLLEGYTIGVDRRTAAVVCVLEPTNLDAPRAAPSRAGTIDRLRGLMADLPSGTVAGEPVMLRDGFAMLERDGNLLGTISALLAGGVLLVCFRSVRWLVVPLAVVLLALWTTRGALAVAGLELTMVSAMLSAMVTVVAIATVTHIIVEFRRRRDDGLPPEAALRATLTTLAWPIAGAIATDMIGFGALTFSGVGPVHDFGVMTSLGAGMVLVAVMLGVPFLALAGPFDADPRVAWGEGLLARGLDALVRRLVRHPRPILGLVAALAAAAIAGMQWLEVETDFTRNFRPTSPTVASYDMVESRLGGAGVWDVLLPTGPTIDGTALETLERLAARLRTEVTVPDAAGTPQPALTKVLSLADVLAAASPVPLEQLRGSTLGSWAIGGAITLLRQREPRLTAALVGRDPVDDSQWLRIMLRARERQPAAAKRAIIAQVRRIVAEEAPAEAGHPGGEVTGFFVLLSRLVDRMLADQWSTFALAAAGILALLTLAFRSALLAAVSLVPNALPILVVLGLLGWAGVKANMGTAMIAAVSLGLSVDSSIHYIAAFRRRLGDGHPCAAALETAHQTAGRAMVFSTLALVVGFLALTTSGFMPTVSFGWLSCLALLGGLVGNLVVLPVLLALVAGRIDPGWSRPPGGVQHRGHA
jgi:predicted RND superfamily exporter protein